MIKSLILLSIFLGSLFSNLGLAFEVGTNVEVLRQIQALIRHPENSKGYSEISWDGPFSTEKLNDVAGCTLGLSVNPDLGFLQVTIEDVDLFEESKSTQLWISGADPKFKRIEADENHIDIETENSGVPSSLVLRFNKGGPIHSVYIYDGNAKMLCETPVELW